MEKLAPLIMCVFIALIAFGLMKLALKISSSVTKKKIPSKYEAWVHAAGMILLLGFMALVTFKDIWTLFQ